MDGDEKGGVLVVLFVGDDWAEDHHDVEVQDESGRGLATARLPEGVEGLARLHELIGRFADPDDPAGAGQVMAGLRPIGARGWRRWPRRGIGCSR